MMETSGEQPRKDGPVSERTPSFGHLLLVWFLVGSSFWTLGFALLNAVPATVPLSQSGGGLLFGTIIIVLLWSVGWYPSLSASGLYFVAEAVFNLILLFGIAPLFSRELAPWAEIGLHSTSIALAAFLVFTSHGRQLQNRVNQRTRSLLKLPAEDR